MGGRELVFIDRSMRVVSSVHQVDMVWGCERWMDWSCHRFPNMCSAIIKAKREYVA